MTSKLPDQYHYPTQTRTSTQINLTNKLSRLLSKRNLSRISKKSTPSPQQQQSPSLPPPQFLSPSSPSPPSNFFFICLSGIPPFDKQYQNLGLPGEMINISLEGLKGVYTDEQYRAIFLKGGFQFQARKMRKIVQEKVQLGKNIVVVYHSFGSFSFMNYLRLFPDHKLSGLIDIGGAPLRYYPLLSNLIKNFHQAQHSFLLQNHIQIHQAYKSDPALKEAGFIPFENSYQTIIFLKLATCKSFETMFEYMHNLPKILKLFLYGTKDRIFPEHLINQKVIYYSYIDALQPEYQNKIKRSFENYYNIQKDSCQYIQEQFIFGIDGGQHSLHMQNKYNSVLKTAISQYLDVLAKALVKVN